MTDAGTIAAPTDDPTLARQGDAATVVEQGFAALCLLATTLGPVYTLRRHLGDFPPPWEDDWFVQTLFGCIYAVAAAAIVVGRRRCHRPSWRAVPLLALVVLGVCSTAWSVAPDQTLNRSALFAGTTVLGAWIGLRFSWAEQVRIVARAMLAGSAASAFVAVVWPSTGTMTDRPGAFWAGIYFNRNSLAPVAALGVLAALLAAAGASGARRPAWLLAAAIDAAVLIQTSARTALVVLLGCLGVTAGAVVARAALRRGIPTRTVALAAATVAASCLVASWAVFDRVVAWAGVDPTLDNRTPLWSFVRMEIGLRRFRGYGFYAYWVAPGTSTRAIGYLNWSPPTAHNGFLELGLGLGWTGLGLALIAVTSTIWSSAATAGRTRGVMVLWPLVATTFFVMADLTESFTLPNQFIWVVFVAAAVAVTRRRVDAEDGLGSPPRTVRP